jgi:hypothetical protein
MFDGKCADVFSKYINLKIKRLKDRIIPDIAARNIIIELYLLYRPDRAKIILLYCFL